MRARAPSVRAVTTESRAGTSRLPVGDTHETIRGGNDTPGIRAPDRLTAVPSGAREMEITRMGILAASRQSIGEPPAPATVQFSSSEWPEAERRNKVRDIYD